MVIDFNHTPLLQKTMTISNLIAAHRLTTLAGQASLSLSDQVDMMTLVADHATQMARGYHRQRAQIEVAKAENEQKLRLQVQELAPQLSLWAALELVNHVRVQEGPNAELNELQRQLAAQKRLGQARQQIPDIDEQAQEQAQARAHLAELTAQAQQHDTALHRRFSGSAAEALFRAFPVEFMRNAERRKPYSPGLGAHLFHKLMPSRLQQPFQLEYDRQRNGSPTFNGEVLEYAAGLKASQALHQQIADLTTRTTAADPLLDTYAQDLTVARPVDQLLPQLTRLMMSYPVSAARAAEVMGYQSEAQSFLARAAEADYLTTADALARDRIEAYGKPGKIRQLLDRLHRAGDQTPLVRPAPRDAQLVKLWMDEQSAALAQFQVRVARHAPLGPEPVAYLGDLREVTAGGSLAATKDSLFGPLLQRVGGVERVHEHTMSHGHWRDRDRGMELSR
mgnify:CR=1 FL=1